MDIEVKLPGISTPEWMPPTTPGEMEATAESMEQDLQASIEERRREEQAQAVRMQRGFEALSVGWSNPHEGAEVKAARRKEAVDAFGEEYVAMYEVAPAPEQKQSVADRYLTDYFTEIGDEAFRPALRYCEAMGVDPSSDIKEEIYQRFINSSRVRHEFEARIDNLREEELRWIGRYLAGNEEMTAEKGEQILELFGQDMVERIAKVRDASQLIEEFVRHSEGEGKTSGVLLWEEAVYSAVVDPETGEVDSKSRILMELALRGIAEDVQESGRKTGALQAGKDSLDMAVNRLLWNMGNEDSAEYEAARGRLASYEQLATEEGYRSQRMSRERYEELKAKQAQGAFSLTREEAVELMHARVYDPEELRRIREELLPEARLDTKKRTSRKVVRGILQDYVAQADASPEGTSWYKKALKGAGEIAGSTAPYMIPLVGIYAGTASAIMSGSDSRLNANLAAGLSEEAAMNRARQDTLIASAVELMPWSRIGGRGFNATLGRSLQRAGYKPGVFSAKLAEFSSRGAAHAALTETVGGVIDEGILEPLGQGLLTMGTDAAMDALGVEHGKSRSFGEAFAELREVWTDPTQLAALVLFTGALTGARLPQMHAQSKEFAASLRELSQQAGVWQAMGLKDSDVRRVMSSDNPLATGRELFNKALESDPEGVKKRMAQQGARLQQEGFTLRLTGTTGELSVNTETALAEAYREMVEEGVMPHVERIADKDGQPMFRLTERDRFTHEVTQEQELTGKAADTYLQLRMAQVDARRAKHNQQTVYEDMAQHVEQLAGAAMTSAAEQRGAAEGLHMANMNELGKGIGKEVQETGFMSYATMKRAAEKLGDTWKRTVAAFQKRARIAGMSASMAGTAAFREWRANTPMLLNGKSVFGTIINYAQGNVTSLEMMEESVETRSDMWLQLRAQEIEAAENITPTEAEQRALDELADVVRRARGELLNLEPGLKISEVPKNAEYMDVIEAMSDMGRARLIASPLMPAWMNEVQDIVGSALDETAEAIRIAEAAKRAGTEEEYSKATPAMRQEEGKTPEEQTADILANTPEAKAPKGMLGVFMRDACVYNEAGGFYVGCVLVKSLRDSKEVQQVKAGTKGKHGIVNPITGEYQQETEAIYVWRRKDGTLEVISGRHKYALALENGTESVICYVFNEDAQHDAKWARLLDFENNMRGDQADELTAAIYTRETGYDDAILRKKGLMRNKSKSKRGILIGREARAELWDRFVNGAVSPMDAEIICQMTQGIRDKARVDEIQRRCCMLLEQKKSWEYISAMVQLMANKESVFMRQGLLDLGADFEADMERAATYVEKNVLKLTEAINVIKSGRKLSGEKKKLAERLGQFTTSSEASEALYCDLVDMRERFRNIGAYPDLVAAASMWDGKSELDPVGMARGYSHSAQEQAAEEAGMTREEWEEAQAAKAAKLAAEEATGSLFGMSGSLRDFVSFAMEKRDIKQQALADGTFMKAPNGEPTQLTEEQWLTVRTKAFKAWFGDWQTQAQIRAVEALTPISIKPGESLDKRGMKAAFEALGEVTNRRNSRKVKFPSSSAGKIHYHKGFDTSTIVGRFGELFESAIPAFELPEVRKPGHKYHPNYERYENYVNKFTVNGESYYIRFTVPIVRNGKPPHNVHSSAISEVHIYKKGSLVMTPQKTAGSPASLFVDDRLADFFASVNEKDVSQMLNENGEPLVVYHQTENEITEFNPRHPGAGRNDAITPYGVFTKPDDKDIGLRGKIQMPLYLRLKNPLVVNDRAALEAYLREHSKEIAVKLDAAKQLDYEYHAKYEKALAAKREILSSTPRAATPQERLAFLEQVDKQVGMSALLNKWEAMSNMLAAQTKEKVTELLESEGYDSLILENDEGSHGRSIKSYVALRSEQVKSATDNRGAFDSSSPNITFSVREHTPEEQNIIDKAKKNGTYLLAPNGERSNLTPKQWAQVRTQAFKAWFGDWEGEPANASKIVDENGEPLVVYHGTDAKFDVFDPTKGRQNMDIQGMFFSPWDIDAGGYGGNVRAFFLNIRKPANESHGYGALRKFAGQNGAGVKAREFLKEHGFDGVNNEGEEYIAFEPTQIKSATDNNGNFDPANANITASLRDMTEAARVMLRRREDDLEGEELLHRWDELLTRLETASHDRHDGAARLGVLVALLESTRSVLPPDFAKLGRLHALMKWAAVYAHLVSTGEVKRDGVLKGAIFEKFVEAMQREYQGSLQKGLSEADAREVLQALGERRLEDALLKVAKECRARLDVFVKARARERIELMAERAYPKKERGRKSPRGKMETPHYRAMSTMLAWMDATPEEVAARTRELRASLEQMDGEEAESSNVTREELEEELRIVQLYGDWKGMSAGQARLAAEDFVQFVMTQRHAWDAKVEMERRRREWQRARMNFRKPSNANTRSEAKREGGLARSAERALKAFVVNSMSYAQMMQAGRKVFGEAFTRSRLQEIADANAALRNARRERDDVFALALMKATGKTREAELVRWLNDFGKVEKKTGIFKREVTHHTLEMTREEAGEWCNMTPQQRAARRRELNAEAERTKLAPQNVPTEADITKLAEELAAMDARASKAQKVKVRVPRYGQKIELVASRDAAANAIMLLEQEDYQHLIEYEGFTPRDKDGKEINRDLAPDTPLDVEQTLKPLYDFIGAEGRAFAYALRRYVGENGKRMQEVYEARQGVPLAMKPNYWRGNFNINTIKEKDTFTEKNGVAEGGGGYGFLIDRVRHYNRLEWTNTATMVFGMTVEAQNNYTFTSGITREWRALLSDTDFQKRMEVELGLPYMTALKEWLDIIDGVRRSSPAMRWIGRLQQRMSRGLAYAALAGNGFVLVKQSSALLHGLLGGEVPIAAVERGEGVQELTWRKIGVAEYAAAMARTKAGQSKVSLRELSACDWFKARTDSTYKNLARRMSLAEGKKQHAYSNKVADKTMDAIEWVDRTANLLGMQALADAVYRDMERINNAQELGLTEEQMKSEALAAVGRALSLAAQPHEASEKSLFAARGGIISNLLFQFKSETVNKLGLTFSRLMSGEAGVGMRDYMLFGATNAAIAAAIAWVRYGDDDEPKKGEEWKPYARLALNTLTGDLSAVPIIGDEIRRASAKVTGDYYRQRGMLESYIDVPGIYRHTERLLTGKKSRKAMGWHDYMVEVNGLTRKLGVLSAFVGDGATWAELVLSAAALSNFIRTGADVAEAVERETE